MMTPESLSREGSPTPGEITLHAAPPHNVSASVSAASVVQAVVEPVQQQIVDIQGMPASGVLNATVLSGQPISVTPGQSFQLAGPGATVRPVTAAPQKLIVAPPSAIGQPRLIVPAQQMLIASNGNGNTPQDAKKEGSS